MKKHSRKTLLLALFALFATGIFAQTRTVTGTVVDDATNETLPLVTVQVRGTTIGTVTNVEGQFTLSVPADAVLMFSFLGYEEVELPADFSGPMEIRMRTSAAMLEGVVITGMFTRQRESFTGSALTVSQEELRRVGNQNILASLSLLDPSFIITEDLAFGSDPNMIPDMMIRGATSLPGLTDREAERNPNQPLFILDGFIATAQQVFDLDMNRVASVTILRDAAAKAIYGSRAANGVVVIETLLPTAGHLRITYTGDLNITVPDLSSYNLTNAEEKLQVEWNAGRFHSLRYQTQQTLLEEYNRLLREVRRGVDTYWLSQPLRVGVGQRHSFRIEGGDPAMRYGVDFSYNNVAGVMKGSNRETISGAINLSYRYRNWTFRNILSVTFNTANNSPYGSFTEYTRLNPYWTPWDEYGNLEKVLGTFMGQTFYNPLWDASIGTKNFTRFAEIREQLFVEWQAMRDLRLTGRFGFTHRNNRGENFRPGDHTSFAEWTGDDFFRRGSYSISNGTRQTISTDIMASYSRQWGPHLLFANAGWNLMSDVGDNTGMRAEGFLNNRVDFITFALRYQENGRPFGSEFITREVGFIGATNYSFDNRYLADVSIRRNASSVFGADSRWGTFWSLGLGWNIHNESFMRGNRAITSLRLRGTLGSTGSQEFDPFQAIRTFNFFADRVYDNIAGAYLMALANNNLSWQEVIERNIGIDATLFRTINIRFDYYMNTTNNLLIDLTLPPSVGFPSFVENLGIVENRGFDATVSWRAFTNPARHAHVTLVGSIAHNTSVLREIADALKSHNDAQDGTTDTAMLRAPLIRFAEGQSMDAIWAVQSLGIDPATGNEIFVNRYGEKTFVWDPRDQIVAGNSRARFRGTFGIVGEYMGFGLSATFRYRWGGYIYNQTLVERVENVNIAWNVDRRVFEETWNAPNDHAYFRRITATPTITRPTTRFVERDNELQLAALTAYYDFRHLNIRQLGLERLRFSFSMDDVFRLSTVRIERGLAFPFARTFSFSLSATF